MTSIVGKLLIRWRSLGNVDVRRQATWGMSEYTSGVISMKAIVASVMICVFSFGVPSPAAAGSANTSTGECPQDQPSASLILARLGAEENSSPIAAGQLQLAQAPAPQCAHECGLQGGIAGCWGNTTNGQWYVVCGNGFRTLCPCQ